MLQRALEGRSGHTERSKGAQGRIMHQRPENRGALNKPTRQVQVTRSETSGQKSQTAERCDASLLLSSISRHIQAPIESLARLQPMSLNQLSPLEEVRSEAPNSHPTR